MDQFILLLASNEEQDQPDGIDHDDVPNSATNEVVEPVGWNSPSKIVENSHREDLDENYADLLNS